MIELRLTGRLIKYWQPIKKDKNIPSIEKFSYDVVRDIRGKCFQVSVLRKDGEYDFVYQEIGDELTDVFERNLIGMRVISQTSFLPAKKMIENMKQAINSNTPIELNGQFVSKNSEIIKYRSCLLPFGNDKDQITDFIIGISWNSFK
jgi:hypothetical protein